MMPNKTSPPTDAPPAPADDAPRVPALDDAALATALAQITDAREYAADALDGYGFPVGAAHIMALADVAEAAAMLRAAELAVDEHRRTVSPWLDKSMTEANPAWGHEQARLRDDADARRVALDAALSRLATGGTNAE